MASTTDDCCICLCSMNSDNDSLCRVTRCTHVFHFDCIQQWCKQQNNCPLCKRFFVSVVILSVATQKKKRRGRTKVLKVGSVVRIAKKGAKLEDSDKEEDDEVKIVESRSRASSAPAPESIHRQVINLLNDDDNDDDEVVEIKRPQHSRQSPQTRSLLSDATGEVVFDEPATEWDLEQVDVSVSALHNSASSSASSMSSLSSSSLSISSSPSVSSSTSSLFLSYSSSSFSFFSSSAFSAASSSQDLISFSSSSLSSSPPLVHSPSHSSSSSSLSQSSSPSVSVFSDHPVSSTLASLFSLASSSSQSALLIDSAAKEDEKHEAPSLPPPRSRKPSRIKWSRSTRTNKWVRLVSDSKASENIRKEAEKLARQSSGLTSSSISQEMSEEEKEEEESDDFDEKSAPEECNDADNNNSLAPQLKKTKSRTSDRDFDEADAAIEKFDHLISSRNSDYSPSNLSSKAEAAPPKQESDLWSRALSLLNSNRS
eukprot:TRINITY_DN787_c0_g1_i1.p1 TRINITY_DN787_c0_g1~~TRINITY_DN787_c0_g1_i1.p1  ORF type:complete len:484 (+),score=165.10 TRINITY_DN787_c0_g1_i1:108-1559(+)